MGGSVIEGDVVKNLNGVFGNPGSDEYKYAQAHNTFGTVQNVAGNSTALIEAYNSAGVSCAGFWASYLRRLGAVTTEGPQQGPQNIYDIAQARYNNLIAGLPMETIVHVPKHGGHVNVKHGPTPASGVIIDSPHPLPGEV